MPANDEITYQIDGDDRICVVGAAWVAFATENNGDHLLPPFILGRELWASISDSTTREVYRGVVSRVRRGVAPVRFQFRCDSPGMRRLLEMHILATAANGVEFRTTLLHRQPRVEVEAPVLPRLSQGMCPSCFEAMSCALDDKDHDPSKVTRVAGLPNG